MAVDWERVNERLPYSKTDEAKEKRKEMWRAIDVNDNGYASLSEITRGVRDVIDSDDLFDSRPAINRAFHHCRKLAKGDREHGDDFLEFKEFRIFLRTLRQFFEYHQAFKSNGGGQILFSEFVDWALEKNLDLEDDIDEEEE